MKLALSTIAFLVIGVAAANATPVVAVPEPATWGLMILGFALLGNQVRAARKAKA